MGINLTSSYTALKTFHQTYCFSPCPTTDDGLVTRSRAQISCYVYNNGNPEKSGLLPSEVNTLFCCNNPGEVPRTASIVPPNSAGVATTTVDPSDGGRCGGAAGTPNMKNLAYCISMCTSYRFTPSLQVCLIMPRQECDHRSQFSPESKFRLRIRETTLRPASSGIEAVQGKF